LAASSALKLNAAWAPIASDTVPASAAAMAKLRRENEIGEKFITVSSLVVAQARGASFVAPWGRFGLRGEMLSVVQMRSICGTATNKPLTRFAGSSNRQLCIPHNQLK
jgi:hypothetical protein